MGGETLDSWRVKYEGFYQDFTYEIKKRFRSRSHRSTLPCRAAHSEEFYIKQQALKCNPVRTERTFPCPCSDYW